ncbi:MAG TPA: M3 family metallopeptidase [Acidobacteriota bacterium]|nr:M3 family metallopeptidase [Acidobacteriota bacterium]
MNYEQTEWDFSDFFPEIGTQEYETKKQELLTLTTAFMNRREQLTKDISVDLFKEILAEHKKIVTQSSKLQVHAYLKTSKNSKDEAAKIAMQKAEELGGDISNKIRFFSLWFMKLPKKKAKELWESLGNDSYAFQKKHKNAKYALSEAEENIISLKDITGASAFQTLYDSITSGFSWEFDGEKKSLTQMRNYSMHPDREKRKQAAQLIYKKFEEYIDILSDIYMALVRDYVTESLKLRNYESPLHVRAQREDISVKAIEALFKATQESTQVWEEFFKIKAKELKLEQLATYDIQAPVGVQVEEHIPYTKAVETIIDALRNVDPSFSDIVLDLIKAKRLDTTFHPNKRGGAYNYSLPDNEKPFVFMQYLGKDRDLSTLAHELGHAVHGVYTQHLSIYSSHPTMGIAETMSTLFEEIVFEHQLKSLPKEKQKQLLFAHLADTFSTISRQSFISMFEKKAHAMIQDGTTHAELSKVWAQLQKEQFRTSVHISDATLTWSYIPHIYHTPYYCYNYSIGSILSLTILEKLKENKDEFLPKLHQFMRLGGTAGTVESAKVLGIDLENPQSWKLGIDAVKKRIDHLKSLL